MKVNFKLLHIADGVFLVVAIVVRKFRLLLSISFLPVTPIPCPPRTWYPIDQFHMSEY